MFTTEGGFQLLDQWEQYFDHPTGSKLGLLGAIQTIGSLGSIPVAPYASDFLGRRGAVMMGGSIMIAGAALQTAAQNVDMFIGSRALRECQVAMWLMVFKLILLPYLHSWLWSWILQQRRPTHGDGTRLSVRHAVSACVEKYLTNLN